MKTFSPKQKDIKRHWHLVDLRDQVLGRVATEIAVLLQGKRKPYFAPHLDCGDYVVAINANRIVVTGRKAKQKKYYRHSGYPGGFKEVPFKKQMSKDPAKIIRHAVAGMLPKNKLRSDRLARLRVYADDKHPHRDKLRVNTLDSGKVKR